MHYTTDKPFLQLIKSFHKHYISTDSVSNYSGLGALIHFKMNDFFCKYLVNDINLFNGINT